ncbi:TetR/AcrR family transcriptional regulator [Alkalibacillus silvisoli]|uniref:TetR/AcrR family transcriptional regulator n=1 Tax=Alkalibacillus silvisoli TaxID=392823 RepID=A0ABN0ZV17_9BACI
MNTKEQIINTSIQLFSDYGYEATTMTKIADDVGIKKPSIYAHFKNKEAIFHHTVEQVAKEYIDFVFSTVNQIQDQSAERILYSVLNQIYTNEYQIEFLGEFFYRFVLFTPPEIEGQVKPILQASEEQLENTFLQIIEKGKTNHEIDPALSSQTILRHYLFILNNLDVDLRYYSLSSMALENHLNDIWKVFWRGIKK